MVSANIVATFKNERYPNISALLIFFFYLSHRRSGSSSAPKTFLEYNWEHERFTDHSIKVRRNVFKRESGNF